MKTELRRIDKKIKELDQKRADVYSRYAALNKNDLEYRKAKIVNDRNKKAAAYARGEISFDEVQLVEKELRTIEATLLDLDALVAACNQQIRDIEKEIEDLQKKRTVEGRKYLDAFILDRIEKVKALAGDEIMRICAFQSVRGGYFNDFLIFRVFPGVVSVPDLIPFQKEARKLIAALLSDNDSDDDSDSN